MADSVKFSGISHAGKPGLGLLKLTNDQFGWKCQEQALGDHIVQFAGKEIAACEWQNSCGRKFCLKVCMKQDGSKDQLVLKFAGFEKKDMEPLKAHLATNFQIDMAQAIVSTKGWSWGDLNLEGDTELKLMMEGKVGLEVPLSSFGQVTAQGKTDLNLEMQQPLGAAADDEVLHEIRLQVIPDRMSAETLQLEIQQKAGLSERGEALAIVSDVMLVAPRGKHNLEFFRQTMKIHGKTQTYTVKYANIARLFLMSMPGDQEMALVMGLEQPLRHGQQLNHFLVFTIAKAMKMVPNLPEDKMKAYEMPLGQERPVYEIIARVLKDLSGKTLVGAASAFNAKNNANSVRCSHKAQSGFLFPLKKSLLFITKPVIWITYDEVESIEWVKCMSRARSFDIVVHLKGKPDVEFGQVETEDSDELIKFFQSANIRLVNLPQAEPNRDGRRRNSLAPGGAANAPASRAAAPAQGDAEEDDEDFDDDAGSSSAVEDDDEDEDVDSIESEQPKKKKTKTK